MTSKVKKLINLCSNENYWTKNQIISTFSESGWYEVRQYRNNLRADFKLTNSVNESISFVMTPRLVTLEIQLHKNINQLSNCLFSYQMLLSQQETSKNPDLLLEQIKKEVFAVVNHGYELQINEKTLNRILLNKQQPNDEGQQVATEYIRLLYSLSGNMLHDKISRNVCGFNAKIANIHITKVFRQEAITKKRVKHYMVMNRKTVKYDSFHPSEIAQRLTDLDATFEQINSTTLFCTAILIYYYIKLGSFFKRFNDISAIAGMYLVIAQEYSNEAAHLNLGRLIFFNVKKLQTTFKAAIESGNRDITDLCYCFMNILNNSLKSQIEKIKSLSQKINELSINKGQLTKIEINAKAQLLCAANLNISNRQATFFIKHNSVGMSYTIDDFRKDTDSSYETSRYSLDNLVKNGFYVKKKHKKKFVFEVVKRSNSL